MPMRGGGSVRRTHRLAVQRTPGRAKTKPSGRDKGMGGPRIWVPGEGPEDEDDQVDGVERFFDYLAYQF